jgi:ferredoxin-NADP reductase
MKAILEYIEQDNQTVKTFWFRAQKPVRNVPGQFTELYLPHDNPDDRGQKRWFTIFSSPTENLFAITTMFAVKSSSFKTSLQNITPGTELDFAEPMGDFILPKDTKLPLLFVAGGIGITPFRSMAKWLEDRKEKRNITLLYATQSEDDQLFIEQFKNANIKIIPVVSKPSGQWTGHSGRLTPELITRYITDPKTHVYMSGPEPMVEKITKELIISGTPKHQVITDYFPGYDI